VESSELIYGDGQLLSILLPVYDAEMTVEKTIRTILDNTGASFELIVVDDGSTDSTAEVIRRAISGDTRAALIQQENQGTGGALKTAAANACGEWLGMIGADDWLAENSLQKRIKFMKQYPGYDIYSTGYHQVYDDGHQEKKPNWERVHHVSLEDLIVTPCIPGNALFRRTMLADIGGFRPQFYNEDYDLWLRMLAHGARHIHQPEYLSYYRIHDNQKTSDAIRMRTDDIAVLSDLIQSGALTDSTIALAQRTISTHKRNIRIRKSLYPLIGEKATEKTIKALKNW
jgi:glycosyltransferase involved in cell wall biosynthesis